MLYKDLLATVNECPFCGKEHRYIEETKNAFLTFAIAPYSKYHLLAIPKRHVESFSEVTREEADEIEKLLHIGSKILEKAGHLDYSVLVRSGSNVGRSVKHVHYHLIPDLSIGAMSAVGEDRKILTEDQISALVKRLKEIRMTI